MSIPLGAFMNDAFDPASTFATRWLDKGVNHKLSILWAEDKFYIAIMRSMESYR